MTLTIGRLSVDSPSSVSWSADSVTIAFNIMPSTLAEAKANRQQALGLANNPDEPVVPVTWDDDPDLDGFYRVTGVTVQPEITYLSNRLMRAQVQLERVGGGYAKASIEVPFNAVVLANDHTNTGEVVLALPTGGGFLGGEYDFGFSTSIASSVDTATGTVRRDSGVTPPVSVVASTWVSPDTFYNGAATVEVQIDGTWHPVVGRQLPLTTTPGGWRISNGLVRLGPAEQSSTKVCRVERWTGSAWVTLVDLDVGLMTGVTFSSSAFGNSSGSEPFSQPVILTNAPNVVTVRVPRTLGALQTVSLRRGMPFATLSLWRPGVVDRHAVRPLTSIASTDDTSHVRRTTADGNGSRHFISTPRANAVNTTTGSIAIDNAADGALFMVGQYSLASFVDWSLTAVAETQRMVAR